ncbi:hypothetical protein SAMN02745687_00927 [Lachnospiraceae bacterium NK3A20]|nr:hypothetical protein SAMN02745687_00927 [Lachnospiraceae bacterium NK3A20]
MQKNDLESRKNRERNRLKKLLKESGADDCKIKLLMQVIENTAWMCIKLEDAREKIETADVAIPYNNGGNQKGLRQNPLFLGYEALWKAYMTGMSQIMGAAEIKRDAKSVELRPRTVLSLVRAEQKQG